MPLAAALHRGRAWTDPKQNCTHQFDAACHAITHAALAADGARLRPRGAARAIPTPARRAAASGSTASSRSSGTSTGTASSTPRAPFDVAPWKGGFMRWADETLPEDDAERAITLRRACDIGMGRGMDLDAIPVASELPRTMAGVCHTMQPGVVEVALRHVGSIRDFARAIPTGSGRERGDADDRRRQRDARRGCRGTRGSRSRTRRRRTRPSGSRCRTRPDRSTGWLSTTLPIEPRNGAENANTPPSDATSQ